MKQKILWLFLSCYFFNTYAQENLTYQKPPKEILQLADFQRAPSVNIDSKKSKMILSYRKTYKTLEDLNIEELRLGGLRIDPVTNISSTLTYITNLKIQNISSNNAIQVTGLPANPRISYLTMAPDDSKVAFANTTSTGVELWVMDMETATAKKLTEAKVNAALGNPFTWMADNNRLLVRMIPANRPALIDAKSNLPSGPTVSMSDGEKAQNRTYQDLLKNKVDETNFENITTSQLVIIDMEAKASPFLKTDMYIGESISPDGKYVMITTLKKPFSYLVPLSRFPQESTVYTTDGQLTSVVNEVPLSEVLPKGFMATRTGKRAMNWRPDQAATLYFVEALDGGDPAQEADFRDALYTWEAPFTDAPKQMMQTQQRFSGIYWGNENLAIAVDYWYDTRNTKSYIFNPSNPTEKPRLLNDRNYQDLYSDPGDFEMKKNAFGKSVLMIENNQLYLTGEGHTPDGQFPFIDALDLKTLKTKRLYQSTLTDKKEDLISLMDIKKGTVLVRMESKNEYPNYYIRTYTAKNKTKAVTTFENPFESIANVHKEVINYSRKDGVALSGTLYLPVGYDKKKKEKLPLLIWAYPREYKDKNTAGQSDANPNTFTFPYYGSFVYWVTRGYAVLDNAAFPIVGEGDEEPNDTFIAQLVANAEAAIDAIDQLGFIDRTRVGVGGHSYGAFMTANLLTHSNLFACGIARSGAYNRTLTPFGFQSEQRNYWEATDVYNTMSPFMNAEKMKTPMLLVHGEADNNPGTFTLQTERYFQALKGLGAPARMVILPKESHGYVAEENILHLLWEQDQFLEQYLKTKKD